ncbi:MAG: amidoligase family protein [Acutalibacteraceae bacterium]|nr:amidoligase family protein [Acutalibacteraceae bacterium]
MLCESCYETYYTHCNDCDRIIHRDHACYYDEEPYCQSCYDRCSEERSIKDYGYKPEPIFYGDGNRFFGVELEVDDAGEDDDNAYEVIRTANRNGKEHIYCKHDGSLDEGFEVVTPPMTLDYHLNIMPWKEVLSELRSMSYCSHNAGSCGLHIHVNRSTFGETTEKQEECIGRVLYLFEKFWSELLKFSRRSYSQLERWAARYGYKDNPKEMLDHAKKGSSNG